VEVHIFGFVSWEKVRVWLLRMGRGGGRNILFN
jgi:hypothetical protein